MPNSTKNVHLNIIMDTLNVSAASLSKIAHVEASLINKWRRGSRQITNRSVALVSVAEALIALDTDNVLLKYYAPYQTDNNANVEALVNYLVEGDSPELLSGTTMDNVPKSGSYQMQYTVYLGKPGFRKAALAMLDYALLLPPGQTIVILCRGRYDWIVHDIPFVIQFVNKLQKALALKTRLLVVGRKGYTIGDVKLFAIPWLVAHMNGSIRSIYYEGDLKDDLRFVATIRDYWCARAIEEPLVEDNLRLRICTDPYETKKDVAVCEAFIEKSKPSSQYAFLSCPQGDEENEKKWTSGPLPPIYEDIVPDGSFNTFCKIPILGVLTIEEIMEISGINSIEDFPDIPDYLFSTEEDYLNAPHRIILCSEAIKECLMSKETELEVLSLIFGRKIYAKREKMIEIVKKLLFAMSQNDSFQVALMPRIAFSKMRLEMICFNDSVTVGWLQNGNESVLSVDNNSASFYEAINYIWDKSLQGWKRKTTVAKTLRKWLSGKGLDEATQDSAIVQNWPENI